MTRSRRGLVTQVTQVTALWITLACRETQGRLTETSVTAVTSVTQEGFGDGCARLSPVRERGTTATAPSDTVRAPYARPSLSRHFQHVRGFIVRGRRS